MARSIRVNESQLNDLATVCAIGSAKLGEIASSIDEAGMTIKREKLRSMLSKGLSPSNAAALCRVVFGLSSVGSRQVASIADTMRGVSTVISERYAADQRFASWTLIAGALEHLLNRDSVYLSAKAIDVSYDFERILSDCRVITSVRPIFNDERTKIVGSAIVHTLRLDYVDTAGTLSSTSVALDLGDLKKLGRICKEACDKGDLARSRVAESMAGDIIIVGEDHNAT